MLKQKKVKIGVTGHLSLGNTSMIEKSLYQVLSTISKRRPNELTCFYSPLSPGADLLSARIALDCSIPLFVIIPFTQDKYLQSFSIKDRELFLQFVQRAEGIINLSKEKQDNTYQMLGDYLVENMDYLIAFWDGQEARGPGGTGEVVNNFRQSHKPLAWIRAENKASNQLVFLPDPLPQGMIQYENW